MRWMKVALGVFLTDTGIKYWAENHLSEKQVKTAAGGKLLFHKLHNYGAAGGLGRQDPGLVRKGTLVIWTGVLFSYLICLQKNGSRIGKLGGSLLLGGGASNLADRLTKGYVTDYISFDVPWKWLRNLVFNLSDFMIFIGTMLCMVSRWKKKE